MNIIDRAEAIADDLKAYFHTRVSLLKLETLDKSSEIGAGIVSSLIVAMVAIFALLFFSLWLSLYLSSEIGVPYIGFLLTGAFYALVFLIFLIGRKSMLEKPIRNSIIAKAAIEEEEEDEPEVYKPVIQTTEI
jgi:hypothetical protein